MRKRFPLMLAAGLAAFAAQAHRHVDEVVIASGTDLRDWCRDESEAHLIGQGKTPVNWTARHHEKANTLIVEGQWRVDGENMTVECRAARGARAEFASMKLVPR